MSDDSNRPSLEETLRAIAQEVTRSVEKLSQLDIDDMARTAGLDPEKARGWVDDAGQWLRTQAENVDFDVTFGGDATAGSTPTPAPAASTPAGTPVTDEALFGAGGPHPLDVPTAEQGAALAALESGRWTLEPGTSALSGHGEGPAPSDALGLVRELRVRDWIDVDGEVTLVGHHALLRWVETAER